MTLLRRAITLSGVKPVGAYQHRFIYRYCFAVVEPLQGDHVFVTAPQANTVFFEFLLQEFAQHEPEVYKIIFLDRAGYHLTKTLQIPNNIHLLYLPSSNPELNPIERFWQDRAPMRMKKQVAFKNFSDEAELEEWIKQTIQAYTNEQISSLTAYPYILQAYLSAMEYA